MKQIYKVIFLILMLAVPAAIFTFLKLFGDNQFDVPICYQRELTDGKQACFPITFPYSIADSLRGNSNSIVAFQTSNDAHEIENIAKRIVDTFDDGVPVVVFAQQQLSSDYLNYRPADDVAELARCVFLADDIMQLVLIDKDGRIRGYYDHDLDEIDRLIVELKIIRENDERTIGEEG